MSFATKGVSQANVNASNLLRVPLPLPPLHDQVRMVREAGVLRAASHELNGKEVSERPIWNHAASADAVRHFAYGISDDNPLWTDPAYAGGSARLDSAIDAIRKLLPAARAKKVPIYYTTSALDTPQFKSAADYSPRFRAWDRRACEIDERVRPEPGELILYKEHASAFAGTPLVGHLIAHRVDTLLITGCSTSACVRATATDAKSNYLKPIIIREAVEDRSEVAHEWTLFDIQARFADVVSANEALKYLNGL
jgi:nicotinamidase-related amidase